MNLASQAIASWHFEHICWVRQWLQQHTEAQTTPTSEIFQAIQTVAASHSSLEAIREQNQKEAYNVFIGNYAGYYELEDNKLHISNANRVVPLIWGDFKQYLIKLNGKVGVGYDFGNYPTTAGGYNVDKYNLFVKGGILTEEVRGKFTRRLGRLCFLKRL